MMGFTCRKQILFTRVGRVDPCRTRMDIKTWIAVFATLFYVILYSLYRDFVYCFNLSDGDDRFSAS